jgi:hypothetical protein
MLSVTVCNYYKHDNRYVIVMIKKKSRLWQNPIERIWLKIKASWFNNDVCKNEQQRLERWDQAILDVINHPEKTQKTTSIGTLF